MALIACCVIFGISWFISYVEYTFSLDPNSIVNYMGAMFIGIAIGSAFGVLATVKLIMYCKKHKLYDLGKEKTQ